MPLIVKTELLEHVCPYISDCVNVQSRAVLCLVCVKKKYLAFCDVQSMMTHRLHSYLPLLLYLLFSKLIVPPLVNYCGIVVLVDSSKICVS